MNSCIVLKIRIKYWIFQVIPCGAIFDSFSSDNLKILLMAEIKIEKKSMPVWPWILVALAFIAILIYLFFPREERNEGDELTTGSIEESSRTVEVSRNATAVLAFVNFIEDDPTQVWRGKLLQ